MTDQDTGGRTEFLGIGFDQLGQTETVAEIARLGRAEGFGYVVTPNVDHVVRLHSAETYPAIWEAYRSSALCLCDSRILQLLSRISGIPLSLVPGSDLTVRILEDNDLGPRSFAVIGGDRDLFEHLANRYPTRRWYHHEPPMGVRKDARARSAIIDFVEECPSELYFFAIGSPQSELLCAEISARGKAQGVALCIGASLEFLAGTKQRAPLWLQKLALEWLYRLLSEPGRLWRRYLIEGPAILLIWWRFLLSRDHRSAECDSSLRDGS